MFKFTVVSRHRGYDLVTVARPRLKAKYYAWKCTTCDAHSMAAPMLASHQVERAGIRHNATHELPEEPCT